MKIPKFPFNSLLLHSSLILTCWGVAALHYGGLLSVQINTPNGGIDILVNGQKALDSK